MAKIRRVDFSPDEWIAGTRELTLEERGAYWDVCSLMYSRGGPLLDDDTWIARALVCNVRTWRKIRERLLALGKLRLVDGQLTNGRTEEEINRARGRIGQAKDAAEESARKRREEADKRAREARQTVENGSNGGSIPLEEQANVTRSDGQNQGVSAKINDLDEATASGDGQANHQPSTTNSMNRENLTETTGAHSDGDAPPKAEARASRLPEDWHPEGELRQWTIDTIRDAGSGVSAGHEVLKFRDYWRAQAGAKGRKLDWAATWRNWIRKAIEMEGRGNGTQRNGNTRQGTTRSSAIRTTANIAAAISGFGGGGSDGTGWGTDGSGVEAPDAFDPPGKT